MLTTSAPNDPVLDHDHSTGAVRGVLHRGCNSGLGVVENGAKRFGFLPVLIQFCMGLGSYLRLHEENRTGFLHPTHKTEDEKRLLRNKRARVARAKKKEQ
ncbi:recombination endonuclease VII [Xanthomonas phage SB4]|uniref:Recombination endonuclease VII n=1 Tax=Xanthomonas phage SB4 TaxID=3117473 RepID=A0ABZ2GUM8_9CAUD